MSKLNDPSLKKNGRRTSTNVPESRPSDIPEFSEEHPPTGDLLYYWKQRNNLFSRYEEGVWLTHDAWYEVTPENVAEKISQHILQSPIETVIDAFCGVGGNTIQFALSASCKRVIAIDTNPTAILCAKHNAHIYGVLDKIEFIVGDFFELLNAKESILKADAVFLSPPWGGPTYRNDKIFDLDTMLPYSASFIFNQASKISKNIALYIPRTSNLNQVAKLVPEGQKIQAVHYCVRKRSKALTVYFGQLSKIKAEGVSAEEEEEEEEL
ncbi:putative diacylglycerol O-acyltransferase tgs1 [Maublancomyces gigas]|uniref:Trimethylguanosine synthase n=1 Tax=Discina gigas TaxID=1032678 RepID=A0ABR3GXP5_9PEZI